MGEWGLGKNKVWVNGQEFLNQGGYALKDSVPFYESPAGITPRKIETVH